MDYALKDLKEWNERIEKIVIKEGLNCYPQEYEICNYEDMLGYESYMGMPSHYRHWSFGKSYEKLKTYYKYNLTGLPYEMVINSNPCIAYLMKDNTYLLQILTIAHVYGHNDFFKNNRLFKEGTNAELTVEMFKNHANRIQNYIQDPSIGYEGVERILDAAHALKLQMSHVIGEKKLSNEEKKKRLIEKYNVKPKVTYPLFEGKEEKKVPDINRIPLEPEGDILAFIAEYGDLEEWEKDIIQIVIDETKYFIPQIETKIINEGWASFWHYRILNQLDLPQGFHIEFLKRHNQVIRPHLGSINPYYVGFKLLQDIEKRFPDEPQKIFEVRAMERDESFLRRYLTKALCEELHLFEYAQKANYYAVTEISDEEGWKKIRDTLCKNTGLNGVPVVKIAEMSKKNNVLTLVHEFDGRELQLQYAEETLKYLADLWKGSVKLITMLSGKEKEYICNEKHQMFLREL